MLELIIRDSPALEGTGRAIVRGLAPPSLVPGCAVRLHSGGRSCGALLDDLQPGDGSLELDKYLYLHLRLRPGQPVEIELLDPPRARSVGLRVPPAWASSTGAQSLHGLLHGRLVSTGQKVPVFTFSGTVVLVEVAEADPAGIVRVVESTQVSATCQPAAAEAAGITYRDVGGLDREIRRIRELVEFPLRSPEPFAHMGIEPPHGVLLYGPPGTGKTLIAKALSNEVGAQFYALQGAEVISAYYGESERRLRDLFEQARQHAPAVILIDEVDALCPHRDQTRGELEQRLVATLLSLMDGLTELKGVVVIGTTNRLSAIDPALRRPGRFEHEIHVGVPDVAGRRAILAILARRMPLAGDVDLDDVASRTPGFVGADLAALCREAGYAALRRSFPAEAIEQGAFGVDGSAQVTSADLAAALAAVQPSAMREVMVQVPHDVTWDQIGGLEEVKQLIVENVVYGIQRAGAYRAAGIRPARGLLLYGPPGTGKTLLARAVACECGANFLVLRGPEVRSKWFGESEEKIRFVFARAREAAPCVLFFDEIDAIAPVRGSETGGHAESIVNQILSEMDGIQSAEGLFVLAATNMADLLDPALLRPGRFDLQVYVPLPDRAAREQIFRVHLRPMPLSAGVDPAALAAETEGCSGADIAEVCRLAGVLALRETGFAAGGLQVTRAHLREALDQVAATRQRLKPRRLGFGVPERKD